jgi:hypothetical protein
VKRVKDKSDTNERSRRCESDKKLEEAKENVSIMAKEI